MQRPLKMVILKFVSRERGLMNREAGLVEIPCSTGLSEGWALFLNKNGKFDVHSSSEKTFQDFNTK